MRRIPNWLPGCLCSLGFPWSRGVLGIAAVLALAGCGEPGPEAGAWQRVGEGAFTPAQAAQEKTARGAQKALLGELMGQLKSVMSAQGPKAAIGVCRDQAPRIAERTGKAHGVKIGRTSFRLRSPANQPPDWAKPLVKERVETATWLANDDGRLAAFLPIRLMKRCVTCHGARASLAPDVAAALAEHYPRDQAVGFAEGDLRGWFWIEVPAP